MDLENRLRDIDELKKIIDSQEKTFAERLEAFRKANKLIEECRSYLKSVELEIEELSPQQ